MIMRLLAPLTLLALTGLSTLATAQAEPDPVDVVRDFQDVLISVMKDAQALGYAGRRDRLDSVVRESHDFPTIARVAAGKHWRHLEREQQIVLIDTFTELSIATYADQFKRYSGEKFEIKFQRRYGEDKALVRAVLSKPGGKQRNFDYILRRFDSSWRFVNITVNGVSDLAVKRAEFGGIIEDKGFDALIVRLKEKIALYETES